MAKVKCTSCGQVIKVPVNDDLKGKKIQFYCKNKACGQLINYRIPLVEGREEDYTMIEGDESKKSTPYLEIEASEFGKKQTLILQNGKQVIGRKSTTKKVDLEIESTDTSMSRQHCYIEAYTDKQKRLCHILSDAESKSGTFLNGKRLHQVDELYLEENDKITIGRSTLQYKLKS